MSKAQSFRMSLAAFFVEKWMMPDGRSILTVNELLLANSDKYSSVSVAGNFSSSHKRFKLIRV